MPLTPKKISDYTATTTVDGTEVIPFAKAGANGTMSLATATARKQGKVTLTIGKTGSGADYECDGVDDQVQFNQAMVAAAASTNSAPATIEVIGYGYAWQYSFSGVVTILPSTSGPGVHLYGKNVVIKSANGYAGEKFITQNFYSEINTNFNSYSTIGHFKMSGFILEGNSGNNTVNTITYANLAAFPGTGTSGKLYVARDTDTGYYWSGSAYTTSGIADTGKHWRAYANHQIKMYAFHSVLEDIQIYDSLEFAIFSEQTNTDTTVFNDYATMETVWRHISIVGYNLGAINWLGPHDGHWYDVGPHTNQYSVGTVLYNVYISAGANYNGGGLVVSNFHPWGNTATYGANVVLDHASIRGDAYIEGSTNGVGLRANSSTMSLNLVTTNTAVGMELTNCYNVNLSIDNYYQFVSLQKMVKIIGTITGSQFYVKNVDNNNLTGSPVVFDITGVTTATNNLFWARIPYTTPTISIGIAATDLDATNEINIIRAGATPAAATIIRREVGLALAANWRPADHGFITWTMDAAVVNQVAIVPTAGQLNLMKVHIPSPTTVTNIVMAVSTPGATLTSGQNFTALYNAAGTLLSATADQSTSWNSAGVKTMALTTPQAVTAGDYYIGFYSNGTTQPTFRTGGSAGSIANIGLATASSRFGTANSGLTTAMPGTASAISAQAVSWFGALS